MARGWPLLGIGLAIVLFAGGARSIASEGTGLAACAWVQGPPCLLGAEAGSSCLMTAICPAGQRVVSGACEGFTSVAIGRSAPNQQRKAWSCAAARLSAIQNANEISAMALCCP